MHEVFGGVACAARRDEAIHLPVVTVDKLIAHGYVGPAPLLAILSVVSLRTQAGSTVTQTNARGAEDLRQPS